MSDGGQEGIPVPETVFFQNDALILGFDQLLERKTVGLRIRLDQLPAPGDIFLFIFFLEPLIDLVPGGGALCYGEPVHAGALGARARQDLDPVAVPDHIIDVDDLIVDLGAHHAVSDRGVDRIGKIDRRRTRRKILDLPAGGKAVDII